jgi:hypothetical protein
MEQAREAKKRTAKRARVYPVGVRGFVGQGTEEGRHFTLFDLGGETRVRVEPGKADPPQRNRRTSKRRPAAATAS